MADIKQTDNILYNNNKIFLVFYKNYFYNQIFYNKHDILYQ